MRSVVDCSAFSIGRDEPGRENQDYWDYLPKGGSHPLDWADFAAIVVDGVGSSEEPKEAAKAAAIAWMEHARAKFIENGPKCADFDDFRFNEITNHAYLQAHEAVRNQAEGTACAASACLQGDKLLVGNVGDCRVYKVSGSGVEQVSEDQVDLIGDPTQVIGGKRKPQAAVASRTVRVGDVVLVCSDGVWKLLSPAELLQATQGASAREIVDKLKAAVSLKRGPDSDDATAIVAVVKQVGLPFWAADSGSGDGQVRDDFVETKVNEVLAELLNRMRAPVDESGQAAKDLTAAVDALTSEVQAISSDQRRARRTGGSHGAFSAVALGLLLVIGGCLIGWAVRDRFAGDAPIQPKLQLPANAKVQSQELKDDRLLVKFSGRDGRERLAIFRLQDGGRPFAIIDLPPEGNTHVPVH